MPRLRPIALLSAVALAAALAPAALAGAAVPNGSDRAEAAARAEHDRIVAFWTPERMAAARPRDLLRQADGTFRMAPLAAPATSSGASWSVANDSTGGVVQKRTGKVYFVMGRSGYVCSGAVAQAGTGALPGNALVLTAGHCLYDGSRYSKRTPNAGFATNWLFIPDFDASPNLNTSNCAAAETKYGCWTARALVVHSGFATQKTFTSTATKYDFGFAVVGLGGKGGGSDLEDVVGGYPLDTSVGDPIPAKGDVLSAFGYPAAAPYDGKVLTYCSGAILEDSRNSNATWGMPCNMTGGSSGGPWLHGVSSTGEGGTLTSLNSYGYSGIANMYGPKFNSATQAVLDYAQQAAGSPIPTSKVVS